MLLLQRNFVHLLGQATALHTILPVFAFNRQWRVEFLGVGRGGGGGGAARPQHHGGHKCAYFDPCVHVASVPVFSTVIRTQQKHHRREGNPIDAQFRLRDPRSSHRVFKLPSLLQHRPVAGKSAVDVGSFGVWRERFLVCERSCATLKTTARLMFLWAAPSIATICTPSLNRRGCRRNFPMVTWRCAWPCANWGSIATCTATL